ncbi:MAG: (d)CMP kinase [Rhizomicrobium sp.]
MVIAVDGTAASGKGTLAKLLARYWRFAHLDSGKLYRLVGMAVLEAHGDPTSESDALKAVDAIFPDLSNPTKIDDLRLVGGDASAAASLVAANAKVRAALLALQRAFAASPPGGAAGACIDGRDIGTVVCPYATAKLFVDARPETRAHRRWLELKSHDKPGSPPVPDEPAILADINARDARDRTRAVAPLVPADDAALLDTTGLDIDAAFAAALGLVSTKVEEALKARHRG